MELQFPKNAFDYLQRVAWEIKNEEQTQEIRLADSFPDIGKILGTWGQPLVRGKEWLGTSMRVSGGVMVWVLYKPEDGSEPRCVETWIPFQLHWDFPQTQHDGTMRVGCQLKGIDARSVSARKIMVRSLVSAVGEALEPAHAEIYHPEAVPEDIQIRTQDHPICLPVEAGETVVTLDEELTPNSSAGEIRKIIYCSMEPELTDQKIIGDKVVYRGNACVHFLCACDDEQFCGLDFDIPFSQYAQLERLYDVGATADMMLAATNLEVDLQENGVLRLKAGIVGQHVVYDTSKLEIVTDAYSTKRSAVLQHQKLELPAVLDMRQDALKAESTIDDDLQILDAAICMPQPDQYRDYQKIRLEIPGTVQILGMSNEDSLVGSNMRWQKELEIPAADEVEILTRCRPKGRKQISGKTVNWDVTVDMLTTGMTDIPMVTGMELGELMEEDVNKPSLILRRVGDSSLWDIAKTYHSTVESIREVNGLTGEPLDDHVLLIPVS